MDLKIKNRKITIQGDSHFIYIPKAYIDNGQIKIDRLYEIILKPQEKDNPIPQNHQEQTINT